MAKNRGACLFLIILAGASAGERERKSHKYINTKMSARSESVATAAGGRASLFSPPCICFRLLRFFSSEQIVPIDAFSKAEPHRERAKGGGRGARSDKEKSNGLICFEFLCER